ncbi:MAG: phosphatidylglycerophosphatase A [Acidobacteriota bacterium]|nr:phosphatidylglycerophosphatase A [Acidobacteriota bacterium]
MEKSRVVSTFLGAGEFPVAPGTLASLVAVLIHAFGLSRMALPWRALVIVATYFLGVAAASATARALGQTDPRRIVIDEVVGQWIALFLTPAAWLPLGLGFLLFRLFDILKPFGIRRVEALPSGWGIMSDDVVAGLAALAVLQVIAAVL